MLQSMTGYAKVICESKNKRYSIEIRSLNSKQMEINTRLPYHLREKDLDIRNDIARGLLRGKIDITIDQEYLKDEEAPPINQDVVVHYYRQLSETEDKLGISGSSAEKKLEIVMRLPEILKKKKEELSNDEWGCIRQSLAEGIKQVITYRTNEGQVLAKDIAQRIGLILDKMERISAYESLRIDSVRQRINKAFAELGSEKCDANRLEQEMIFYLEKMDITEEKVRLKNHCHYFLETMNEKESTGKKLGFISQEIAREINTIGAKANEYNIQVLVVQMKDEVEKIKEQLMNIL